MSVKAFEQSPSIFMKNVSYRQYLEDLSALFTEIFRKFYWNAVKLLILLWDFSTNSINSAKVYII